MLVIAVNGYQIDRVYAPCAEEFRSLPNPAGTQGGEPLSPFRQEGVAKHYT